MGVIVERVSGQSLREFANEKIFRPLKMNRTLFHDDHQMLIKNKVTGYQPDKDAFRLNAMQSFDNVGSGGLRSCVADLVKWDQNFYASKIGGKNFLPTMLTHGQLNDGTDLTYAFGLVIDLYKGLPVVRHGGAMMGFRTHVIRFPEQEFTAICLANLSTMQPGALVERIADIYLKDNIEQSLQGYVGRYVNESLSAAYTVSTEGVNLWIDSGDLVPSKLSPSREDRFTVGGLTCQFNRDDGGLVSSLLINTQQTGDVIFSRVAK
jgi:CubicO group peptidase (beta-lactamase class C family)